MKLRTIMITSILALGLLNRLAYGAATEQPQPAAPQASAEAQKVLAYLKSIQGEKMLAGHHVMYGRLKDRDLRYLVETTDKHPALIEFEGGIFARKYHEDYTAIQKQLVQDAIAYWQDGGLIAICWHWGNPLEPRNTYPNTKIKFDIEAAFKEGTPEHEAMMKDLDVTAEMLKELRDAHVPVLWRPLHEICGGWFWWSMQGQENAEKLWRFIYTYYTEHHKLNNLLWVYSFSHDMRTDWFPGLEYMDVVGVDIYREGQQGRHENFDKMASVAGAKPIALSECDIIPDPDKMKEQGFLWSWFTTWHGRWMRKNDPTTLKHIYNHELVLTRDELPDWK
jgi:mannan endo-1,4-beta-mannosidase